MRKRRPTGIWSKCATPVLLSTANNLTPGMLISHVVSLSDVIHESYLAPACLWWFLAGFTLSVLTLVVYAEFSHIKTYQRPYVSETDEASTAITIAL